ncbi:MAG TPA: 2-oxoacid:acceptor oxidoreductase subunit alpha [bacterium]|nr:2-oxoacid:acceptor oxidoreductase subunit alpha [bacterium]
MAKKKAVGKTGKKTAKKIISPHGVSIVLAGEAGQGIQSIETLLVNVLKKDGFHVFATKEYMSRVRGGVNSTQLRVSQEPVRSYVDRMDIFIPLDGAAFERYKNKITKETAVIGDKTKLAYEKTINIPFNRIASEFGNALFSNTVAAGAVCGILGGSEEALYDYVKSVFARKGDEIVKSNIGAAKSGYEIGRGLKAEKIVDAGPGKKTSTKESLLLAGADAVAIGALAGGCDACFAYPMTPSTGVFTAMAGYASKAGIAVEQVEDEIGVINMALGAWYAGGRALVSTSGGGFALMTEGISLAGIIESPVVVHLAQRPGPATGLPTRTEQGDLNLALYAGHGVFPRIILAPGDTKQAFELSAGAFNLADKYQVPVFVMTDQYFVDTYYDTVDIDASKAEPVRHITETKEGYKRYALTKDGFSPRGIPSFGSGLVCADSDEHDESGRITEDLDGISKKMKDKRFKKFDAVKKAALPPVLTGPKNYTRLVVGWGSVYNTVIEALGLLGDRNTAFLFFPQVYPVPIAAKKYLEKAKTVIAVENNQTGQFADLLSADTGINISQRILKYNGMPFSVEELVRALVKKPGKAAGKRGKNG